MLYVQLIFFCRMTILSSREHTCIQTPWRDHSFRNKTEMCRALLDPLEVHTVTSHSSKIAVLRTHRDFFFCWKPSVIIFSERKAPSCNIEIISFISLYCITFTQKSSGCKIARNKTLNYIGQ